MILLRIVKAEFSKIYWKLEEGQIDDNSSYIQN